MSSANAPPDHNGRLGSQSYRREWMQNERVETVNEDDFPQSSTSDSSHKSSEKWNDCEECHCASHNSPTNYHTKDDHFKYSSEYENVPHSDSPTRARNKGFLSLVSTPITNFFKRTPEPEPIPSTISQLLVQAAVTASAPVFPTASTMRPMVSQKKHRINFYHTDFPSQAELQKLLSRKKARKSDVYKRMHKQKFRANGGTYEENRDFVITFATALMRYGAPPHRINGTIESAGKCIGLSVTCCFIAFVSFISITDPESGTHQLKIVKEVLGYDLDRSMKTCRIYLKVYRDEISPSEGTKALSALLASPPRYTWWQVSLFAALSSFTVCPMFFSGSVIDTIVAFPLGFVVTALEYIPGNSLYSNIYEILATMLAAFVSAALASTRKFCYSAVLTSSIVWLLPGYTLTLGALEISAVQSMLTGAARVCFVVAFAIALGMAITMGTSFYAIIDSSIDDYVADYKCLDVHDPNGPWWQAPVSQWYGLIIMPICAVSYFGRMHLMYRQEVFYVGMFIATAAWGVSTVLPMWLPDQPSICYTIEAFTVGLLANIYGKYFQGTPYVVMLVATLFLVPSALKVNGGGLYISVSQEIHGQAANSYLSGFQIAMTMVSLAICIAVGLCMSIFIIYPNHVSRKKYGVAFSH